MNFVLDKLEIDNHGRVIIKDPKFTKYLQKLKQKGQKYLVANVDSYCDPDSNCPVKNVGCGCPTDSMCTCVAQCGCTNSLCNCA